MWTESDNLIGPIWMCFHDYKIAFQFMISKILHLNFELVEVRGKLTQSPRLIKINKKEW